MAFPIKTGGDWVPGVYVGTKRERDIYNIHPRKLTWIPKMMGLGKGNSPQKWQFLVFMLDFCSVYIYMIYKVGPEPIVINGDISPL